MTNKAKTTILIAISFLVFLSACDRKSFVKKIVGTWTLDKYLFSGQNKTVMFDTLQRDWKLDISEEEVYAKTWFDYTYQADSLIRVDTLGYDSAAIPPDYIIHRDTLRYNDTTTHYHKQYGKWTLINSEEDLQLRNDSDNTTEIYRILELSKSNLNLRRGNEEFYLKK